MSNTYLDNAELPEISEVFDGRINCPARMLFIGSTNSGKSHLMVSMILSDERIFNKTFDEIHLLSLHFDPIYVNLQKKYGDRFKYHKELPDSFEQYLPDGNNLHKCIIIEDMQEVGCRSEAVANLFCVYSKHKCCSVFMSLQDIMVQGRNKMTLFRNSSHIVLFKPVLDHTAINILASRLFPKNSKVFLDIYHKALQDSGSYPYLFIDGTVSHPNAKFRTNLLNRVQNVYIPNV